MDQTDDWAAIPMQPRYDAQQESSVLNNEDHMNRFSQENETDPNNSELCCSNSDNNNVETIINTEETKLETNNEETIERDSQEPYIMENKPTNRNDQVY